MDVSGTIRSILNQKSDEVFSISPDATVLQAVEMMDAKNVGALLVMDKERLVGIISERDLLSGITCSASTSSPNAFGVHRNPYNCHTVIPATIARTARPLSFQPSNGELREADSN